MMIPCSRFSATILSKAQRKRIDDNFEQAKARLIASQGQGPFVLAANVPQSIFDGWDDDGKAAWGLAYDSGTRSILMYGETGSVHSSLQGYFTAVVGNKLAKLSLELAGISSGTDLSQSRRDQAAQALGLPASIRPLGRTTMYTKLGAKSPDASFYTDGYGSNSVVLEVAHRNESLAVLREEVAWWHEAGVGLALGIFVDPNSDCSDPNLILLSQCSYQANSEQKRFGRLSGCTRSGLPDFQLHIPLKYLLHHQSHQVLNNSISIDLYEIQQRVIR